MSATAVDYVRSQFELLQNWRRSVRGIARADAHRALQRVNLANEFVGPGAARYLDIGCGQRCQNALVYSAFGKQAFGIDLEPGTPMATVRIALQKNLRTFGPKRAVRSMVRQLLFDPTYYREMAAIIRRDWQLDHVRILRMNAEKLAFGNETFDFASSDQVWEHLIDVDAATREVQRVLRPGGIVSMTIALFPSLSGGHHFSWANPQQSPSTYVAPWDHLRRNSYPADAYLNRFNAQNFQAVFEKYFEVLQWVLDAPVGRDLLTPEIRSELKGYSDEELLTPNVTVLARKRG